MHYIINIILLEVRDKYSLHTHIFLTNLLDEWKLVETINFKEIPERTEPKYENPGLMQTSPNYNRSNTPTPVPKEYKHIQDDTNRPPVLPPRLPECRPLPNPPASGNRSPVQKNFPHGVAVPPTYTNTVIRMREPYPNYSDQNRPSWPHKENIEMQHNFNKERYQQETGQTPPTFETKQLYHEVDPMGIFGEGKTIIHESPPKIDDVDRLHIKEDRPPFPPPYRPDYYPPSDTNGYQLRTKRSHSLDILSGIPDIPPRSVTDTTVLNIDRRLEPKPGDPEYANCVDTHTHRPIRIPVNSDTHRLSGFTPVDTLLHRPSPMIPVDTQMQRPTGVIPMDSQMHRPTGVIPMDSQMHRPTGVIPMDSQMHRPTGVIPMDSQMHRPTGVIPMDSQMHRAQPSQVVLVDNQMQRPSQALPGDTRSTGGVMLADTHLHRHTVDTSDNSDFHRPNALITSKYNIGPRMHMREYDGGQPMKTSDEYLIMFAHSDEEGKDTQQQIEGERGEDSSMGVFNLKEMINEKTETIIDEQGKCKVYVDIV